MESVPLRLSTRSGAGRAGSSVEARQPGSHGCLLPATSLRWPPGGRTPLDGATRGSTPQPVVRALIRQNVTRRHHQVPHNTIARGLVMRRCRYLLQVRGAHLLREDVDVSLGTIPARAGMVLRTGRCACSRKRTPGPDALSPGLGTRPRPGTSQGLFRDFHSCPREFPGTFRRVSREGPDGAERQERAGQGLYRQHSMMFTASPPRAVSLYFTDMSVKVSFMVLMTLLASTYAPALPSRWQARRRQHTFHCSSRRAPGQGRRGCSRRAPRSAGHRPGRGGQPDDRRSAGTRGGPGWNWP